MTLVDDFEQIVRSMVNDNAKVIEIEKPIIECLVAPVAAFRVMIPCTPVAAFGVMIPHGNGRPWKEVLEMRLWKNSRTQGYEVAVGEMRGNVKTFAIDDDSWVDEAFRILNQFGALRKMPAVASVQ